MTTASQRSGSLQLNNEILHSCELVMEPAECRSAAAGMQTLSSCYVSCSLSIKINAEEFGILKFPYLKISLKFDSINSCLV